MNSVSCHINILCDNVREMVLDNLILTASLVSNVYCNILLFLNHQSKPNLDYTTSHTPHCVKHDSTKMSLRNTRSRTHFSHLCTSDEYSAARAPQQQSRPLESDRRAALFHTGAHASAARRLPRLVFLQVCRATGIIMSGRNAAQGPQLSQEPRRSRRTAGRGISSVAVAMSRQRRRRGQCC